MEYSGILKKPWPKATLFNVNVPKRVNNLDYAVTKLGHHDYTTDVSARVDPRGAPYYWIGGTWSGYKDLPGTDCRAIAQGQISVTPISLNLTYEPLLKELLEVDTELNAIALFEETSQDK